MDSKKLRMFAGEYKEGNIKPLYAPDSKDFKNGDCVVVMHRDDYLLLVKHIKGKGDNNDNFTNK